MSEPIAWSIGVQAVNWTQEVVKSVRSKRQQQVAHIVGNAGVVVAGLRALDRRFKRLFIPLLYFEPTAWPDERRQQWANDIAALAYEDVILPRMAVALGALRTNALDAPAELREALVRLDEVCGGFLAEKNPAFVAREQLRTGTASTAGFDAIVVIEENLPELVELLRSGDDASAGEAIRTLAQLALKNPRQLSRKWRSLGSAPWINEQFGDPSRFGPLRPLADAAEACFGEILAFQQREFPSLPSPDWVWADA